MWLPAKKRDQVFLNRAIAAADLLDGTPWHVNQSVPNEVG